MAQTALGIPTLVERYHNGTSYKFWILGSFQIISIINHSGEHLVISVPFP